MLHEGQISKEEQSFASPSNSNSNGNLDDVRVTCFSEAINDVPIHFQIICLSKQVFHGFPKPSFVRISVLNISKFSFLMFFSVLFVCFYF